MSRGIGPFFIENEQGEAVKVNGDRYRAMLNEFLFTKIKEEDIGNIWFEQDGALCHTEEATLDEEDSKRSYHDKRIFVHKEDIGEEDIGKIWFQQDDAICHTAEATLDVLRPVF